MSFNRFRWQVSRCLTKCSAASEGLSFILAGSIQQAGLSDVCDVMKCSFAGVGVYPQKNAGLIAQSHVASWCSARLFIFGAASFVSRGLPSALAGESGAKTACRCPGRRRGFLSITPSDIILFLFQLSHGLRRVGASVSQEKRSRTATSCCQSTQRPRAEGHLELQPGCSPLLCPGIETF